MDLFPATSYAKSIGNYWGFGAPRTDERGLQYYMDNALANLDCIDDRACPQEQPDRSQFYTVGMKYTALQSTEVRDQLGCTCGSDPKGYQVPPKLRSQNPDFVGFQE